VVAIWVREGSKKGRTADEDAEWAPGQSGYGAGDQIDSTADSILTGSVSERARGGRVWPKGLKAENKRRAGAPSGYKASGGRVTSPVRASLDRLLFVDALAELMGPASGRGASVESAVGRDRERLPDPDLCITSDIATFSGAERSLRRKAPTRASVRQAAKVHREQNMAAVAWRRGTRGQLDGSTSSRRQDACCTQRLLLRQRTCVSQTTQTIARQAEGDEVGRR
jgi:hypothetical protein